MDDRTLRQLQTLGHDLCALSLEAASVVWLRTQRIAGGGPGAAEEASLMVTEKIAAQQELFAALLAGRLGRTPLAITTAVTRRMLKGVRANRRRLARR
jgi:hypothetical protein